MVSLELQNALVRFPALPASYLLRTDHFDRYQDVDVEWMTPERCWLLLFVSHRWEHPLHPDPHGHQHRALRQLVLRICDLAEALLASGAAERLRLVPDLGRDGVVQAAVLLSRLKVHGDVEEATPGCAHRTLPDHIGFWYDYACLPQTPRSDRDEAMFRAGLLDLDRLFRADVVTLVALRQAGDDYQSRAWCLAESLMTANKIVKQGVALRIDRIGEPLTPVSPAPEQDSDVPVRLAAALSWWRHADDPAAAADCLQLVSFLAGHSPMEWFRDTDGIPPVYLGNVVARAGFWLGAILGSLGRSRDPVVDLAAVLRHQAARAGVRCSVDNDLVYVMLLMLEGAAAPDSAIAHFYRQCRERHLAGLPLQVRRIDAGGDGLDSSGSGGNRGEFKGVCCVQRDGASVGSGEGQVT